MHKLIFFLFLVGSALFTLNTTAQAYTILDEYWGGKPSSTTYGNRDVIGDVNYYDTQKMEVTFAGTTLNVAVYSSFIDQLDSKKIWDDKTKLGDLFIGTNGWNPTGSSANHYAGDTRYTTGTNWNYAVVLDYHGPNQKGDTTARGNIYLYSTADGSKIESNAPSGWIYRDDQLVQFKPNAGITPLAIGTWSITDISGTIYDKLLFSFDATELLSANTSENWAFHWAMTCGNDVIEGSAPIPNPEPSTLLLTGLGLLGAAYLRRKRSH